MKFLLAVTAWTAPLLILTAVAAWVRPAPILLVLRAVYFPYLALMGFAFYWFWGGDGALNLWLVPLVFGMAAFLLFRYLGPRFGPAFKRFDMIWFHLVLAGYLSVWVAVFLYRVTGQKLVIA